MNHCIPVIITAICLSCCGTSGDERPFNKEKSTYLIIPIRISNGIVVNWNEENSRIMEDKAFHDIEQKWDSIWPAVYSAVSDTSRFGISSCIKTKKLSRGDFAFMLAHAIDTIPLSEIIDIFFDEWHTDCSYYPIGLFDELENVRPEITDNLKKWKMKKINLFEGHR